MIRYPNQKQPYQVKTHSAANRGQALEAIIDDSNTFYRVQDIAVIHKKPTPVQIVRVDYPSRQAAKIIEAYYKTPSTTDYNGIYKGRYLDFDAKETRSKTSFPIKNIHAHQWQHLEAVSTHGGYAFIILGWILHDAYYLVPFTVLKRYYDESLRGGRQSIPYEVMEQEAYRIKEKQHPRLDYLEAFRQWQKE